jgi:hypothetical protein
LYFERWGNQGVPVDVVGDALPWIIPGKTTLLALIHHYDLQDAQPDSNNEIPISTSFDDLYKPFLTITYSIH